MKNIIVGDRVRVSAHATGNGLSRIGILDAIYPDLGTTLVSISFIDDINSKSEFAGCKGKLTLRQIKETAAMIVETYPHYNLTEFMLFFQRFKRCRYGRFYGAVDPMIIFQSLDEFNEERRRAHIEREAAENDARRAEEERKSNELKQLSPPAHTHCRTTAVRSCGTARSSYHANAMQMTRRAVETANTVYAQSRLTIDITFRRYAIIVGNSN